MNKLEDLSWDKDKKTQEEAISFFSNDGSFNFNQLIKKSPKKIMSNLVEVITNKKIGEQYQSIKGLLYLLKDLSWPGSEKAMSLLKSYPKEALLPDLENTLKEASQENDDNWLGNLKMLIKYHLLTKNDFKSLDFMQVLEKAAW
ncbi:MAG: hypothetical protein VZQ47_04795 [Treponema sp.]|nr:hypothetical protein [Treponema sp.]MEE3434852.1 hypothetical protein [Treponema sp.]